MKSKIYEQLDMLASSIMEAHGSAMIFAHDGESKDRILTLVLHNADEATAYFLNLFRRYPEFIPCAMYAAGKALDKKCDGDCENCDRHDDDDDDDDDGPAGLICMN